MIGQEFEVQFERMSRDGGAVARAPDGRVIFVQGGAPGDIAQVRVTEAHKRHFIGELVEIRVASPHRVTPPCVYFQTCGGCPWQHIDYPEQLRQKTEMVRSTLQKFKTLSDSELARLEACAPSPKIWRYRQRLSLHVGSAPGSALPKVGFRARGTHDFVAVDDCRIGPEGAVQFALSLAPQALRNKKSSSEEPKIDVRMENSELKSGAGFVQVNAEQNQRLQDYVSRAIRRRVTQDQGRAWTVYDLYGGSGNWSRPLVEQFEALQTPWRLRIVESHPSSEVEARRNFESAQSTSEWLRDWAFHSSDVETWIRRHREDSELGIFILNPPRQGLSPSVIERLARRRDLVHLIMVSCDPNTLARDLTSLRSMRKMELIAGASFDLFPHTDHVEVVTVWEIQKPS
ncbi:MAG TPA: TRAM domain-containing protein [Pseudobdellovibrionaceae bacterium]|nr:TRAM domain-containing protein [Pseudobdellovibrionaceae bacterium]